MRVLWPHNFNPDVQNSGNFMYTFAHAVKSAGVDLELLYLGKLDSPNKLLAAREEVRRQSCKFDLTHSQFGSACAFASAGAHGSKILSLRGSDWHRYFGVNFRETFHALAARSLTSISLNSFDAVVTMSERMKHEVLFKFPLKRVVSIPDPIDTELFLPRQRSECRRILFNTSSNEPWVLFTTLSKSNPIKRVTLALDAVKIASRTVPGLKLKIASGLTHDKMPLFVSACNLALCTSMHEGWPNSLKEALACGIPFVSTDVSDMGLIAKRRLTCHVEDASAKKLAHLIIDVLATPPDSSLPEEILSMSLSESSLKLISLYTETIHKK